MLLTFWSRVLQFQFTGLQFFPGKVHTLAQLVLCIHTIAQALTASSSHLSVVLSGSSQGLSDLTPAHHGSSSSLTSSACSVQSGCTEKTVDNLSMKDSILEGRYAGDVCGMLCWMQPTALHLFFVVDFSGCQHCQCGAVDSCNNNRRQEQQRTRQWSTKLPSTMNGPAVAHTFLSSCHRNRRYLESLAVELVQEIGRRATLITAEPRESTFLF